MESRISNPNTQTSESRISNPNIQTSRVVVIDPELKRRMTQISSKSYIEILWDALEIRVMVLFSLTFQIIFIAIGSRRKYSRGVWIQVIVGFAYIISDSMATLTLAKLSAAASQIEDLDVTRTDHRRIVQRALWAPLLLTHLGGPDTITDFCTVDSNLWVRHLRGLVVQLSLAIYIFIKCWSATWLSKTIPLFISGVIKYGERTWVLWHARNEEPPKVSLISKKDYNVILDLIKDNADATLIMQSYISFRNYKHYFADYEGSGEQYNFAFLESELLNDGERFSKFLELELSFMYDVLYTKAAIIYTWCGCAFRCISFSCMVVVLVQFSILDKDENSPDVIITYILLAGAIVLEVCSVILMIYSDWGILLMIKHFQNHLAALMLRHFARQSVHKWKKWSNSVAQFNLLRFCIHDEDKKLMVMLSKILKFFRLDQTFKMWRFQTHDKVQSKFRNVMVEELKEIVEQFGRGLKRDKCQVCNTVIPNYQTEEELHGPKRHQFITNSGVWALERYECDDEGIRRSIDQKYFDESIIIWHIATDICYHTDLVDHSDRKEASKLVSDYMMYLLVSHPDALSIIIAADFRFNQLHKDISSIMKIFSLCPKNEVMELCNRLVCETDPPPDHPPALNDAVKLAKILKSGYPDKLWKIVFGVWMDKLCHVAKNCQVNHHAELLRNGGELLNHVWAFLSLVNLEGKGHEQEYQTNQGENP
ncbi:hypothetical protein F0562_030420 [Nyssa sinensis]|uniref:DUF4220 domain-containing protein n=1 Tax=Nyssa sinensis TaxID=561372 RepID=A0A5J5B0Y0_9ASTE|nr:hypothetical protein F0562_030420 [Nyssa sinensis]